MTKVPQKLGNPPCEKLPSFLSNSFVRSWESAKARAICCAEIGGGCLGHPGVKTRRMTSCGNRKKRVVMTATTKPAPHIQPLKREDEEEERHDGEEEGGVEEEEKKQQHKYNSKKMQTNVEG